jgi:hypothetical protein
MLQYGYGIYIYKHIIYSFAVNTSLELILGPYLLWETLLIDGFFSLNSPCIFIILDIHEQNAQINKGAN